ncbi:MAG: amino acid adenylation domain-containing protein [Syntrophobacteraceae bacterium]|nr:amino acid adenylation domain-containing protein [Syntrophobacteraceae bacterium]
MMALHHLLDASVKRWPANPAVIEGNGGGRIDYRGLGQLSDRVRDRLVAMGVRRGDRVGMYLRKSIDGVAALFGILKAGAAYVPADPGAPACRVAFCFHNCAVKAVIVAKEFEGGLVEEISRLGSNPERVVLPDTGGGAHLFAALQALDAQSAARTAQTVDSAPEDLAYILYTSGSTGAPKGVMLSHRNGEAFVGWGSQSFTPRPSDIFSSHAPFHFDLSIFDIYVSLKHGASLVLIGEKMGKSPRGLAELIERQRITIWYSAPSTLSLLAQFGKISERDFSALRTVIFAGEVFPIAHLRSFKQQVPAPCLFNLYGPTETNVCTWFAIPPVVESDRIEPYPIGKTCSNLESVVVDPEGQAVERGAEGELCIAGPQVMQGYWNLPEQTARALFCDPSGKRWYRTGDRVTEAPDGNYHYRGRKDRMIKRHGYRIEPGEIEACLYRHPSVSEAGVVATSNCGSDIEIKAHLSVYGEKRLSIIELKTFCSERLPLYMVPDTFRFHGGPLPKTSTDKIDYQSLQEMN